MSRQDAARSEAGARDLYATSQALAEARREIRALRAEIERLNGLIERIRVWRVVGGEPAAGAPAPDVAEAAAG